MKTLIAVMGTLAVVAFAATGFVVVDETEHVVVTQFGRPVAVHSQAGAYRKLPNPIQRVVRLDRRILYTPTPQVELLTADKKNVLVSTYLSWRIADPIRFLGALRVREAAEARLVALVQSELGSALGAVPFEELVPGEGEGEGVRRLETRVHETSRRVALEDFGIELASFGLTRLGFPNQNLQSVFARMRAERERIARGHRSEGEAEAQKLRAEADRQRAEILASAEAEAERLRGEGEAQAARIYAEAYRGHERFYRFLRTLESYERILDERTTLVLPADSPFLELLLSRDGEGTGSLR